MGRRPCCTKQGLNRGAWTALEDQTLIDYINTNGEGNWRKLPERAGLKRCGKSCRLRWSNYLRPDIKRGNITRDEEDLIIRLHKLLGNRKKIQSQEKYICLPIPWSNDYENPSAYQPPPTMESKVVRAKAVKCTKVFIEPLQAPSLIEEHANTCNPPHPIMGEAENNVIIVSNDDDKYPGTSGENAVKLLMDLESMNDLINFNLLDLLDYDFCPNILEFGN
ncbi:hypothetical protein Ancab_017932 [Ancistrocladus abbreviatus]